MSNDHGSTHSSIPIQALHSKTREKISSQLNPMKVIPTEEGLPRDWRGLAQLAGLQLDLIPQIGSNTDPTARVLNLWSSSTLGQLIQILRLIDRHDIVDDTAFLFDKDAEKYAESQNRSSTSAPTINLEVDKQILTVDDVSRLDLGLAPQYYDAFLLFADEDIHFASQIVDKMESKYNLKLCLRDRDLVGGLTFEHEAIMRLIAERCNRLMVIVSPSFLKSEANKFFVTFAQALGIEQRQRKVVPCLYQRCILPPELSYYFLLDFTRSGTLWDFWAKMRDSLQTPIQRSIKEKEENKSPQESSSLLNVDILKGSDNSAYYYTDTKARPNTDIQPSIEIVKPKSGKWLRRLLPKNKSKKKRAEALS